MVSQIFPLDDAYINYLRDESRLTGHAESISFPTSEQELLEQLAELRASGVPITIQGGQSGIAGGAVAKGGHILNLSRMNHLLDIQWAPDGSALVRAEAGMTMLELRQAAAAFSGRRRIFWPPEPTSLTATIGGAAATGAKGILAGFGTETYIEAARMVKEDGTVLSLAHGDGLLEQTLGAEGLPGVFTELTLRLLPEEPEIWGICVFFEGFDDLCSFVEQISQCPPGELAVAEYLDATVLRLADGNRKTMVRLKSLPPFPAVGGVVYMELHGTEEAVMSVADRLLEKAVACGCDDQQIWAVSGMSEVERLRELRVSVQELIGMHFDCLSAELPRLVTDMSFPRDDFRKTVLRYHGDAEQAGLTCCVYGHILQKHLTACLLPETPEAHENSVGLLRRWAEISVKQGGETVRSYGIGILTKQLLRDWLPDRRLRQCRQIVELLAPDRSWNRSAVLDIP